MKIIITTRVLVYCALFGMVLIVSGVVLGFRIFPKLVEKKVWENTLLQNDTRQFEMFKRIPFALDFKVYFFNVRNPDAILQGAKPIVNEVGPYQYKLYRSKDEVTWNKEDEISYYDHMRFEFNKEASGKLSDEDTVTILNLPLYALLVTVEQLSPGALPTIDSALSEVFQENNNIFITGTVKDFLFEGIVFCKNPKELSFAAKMVCSQFKGKSGKGSPMSFTENGISYAYLRFKNDTHLGRFTIKSGSNVREDVSNLIKFNNESHISVWGDEETLCNKIQGTTLFRPYVTQNMTFEVFSEDICRSLHMAYQKTEVVKGIEGYRYEVREDSLNQPTEDSKYSCYCGNKSKNLNGQFECLNNGLFDLTNCLGAPLLLSFPHILYGDKEYISSVEGLHPNRELHDTFVILEPISGAPLKMAKRVQFNMIFRAIEDIPALENVTSALLPLLWMEESMTLDDHYVDIIRTSLLNNLKILEAVKWTLIGAGVLAIGASAVLILYSN